MDEKTRTIVYAGQVARLTGKQFQFFRVLLDAFPRVLSRDDLVEAIYANGDDAAGIKVFDVMACKIRPKIEPLGLTITTQWGIGYRIELDEEGKAAVLRARRFEEGRKRRIQFEGPDLPLISVYRQQGYPITDIARRLNLSFRAVTAGLDAIESAKVPAALAGRQAA
ncbi:winged helix-turn-helix domain-containing protein [Aureimonas phyllosphaerae]|uniref:winged helix-turn-helix domain-containing protein n=1 Tax=Aureimonas phyllosphaerae TaxID=1166078 RepID=UPI003A5C5149